MDTNEQLISKETSETVVLTPEEKQTVEQYKAKIDLNNKSNIIQYGAATQSRMVAFSETVLTQIRNKDLGSVGETLSGLVSDLKTFDKSISKPGGFWGFLMSLKKKLIYIKSQYSRIETNVVQVERQLERHYQTLLKDIHLFDRLYEQNEQYYRDISLYIYAGEEKIKETQDTVLPQLKAEAEQADDPRLTQQCRDMEQQINQFDKKLHDLKLSRMISLQLAPQIRLVQNNSSMLMDKIQSSIVNTLPLWRNQMVLALGLVHSQQALEAQKAVNDATNKMLQRNSEMLRSSSTKIAIENERSIVDIDTLKKVNTDLFATIEDVLKIQEDGRQKRHAAEKELLNVENEFKTKLMIKP
ncbi:MAG: toxic anion resistance protein [Tannerella sp.]|jgi:uncharacterized protein YaaN involved in tellurite resistance|nr:toxic anion resistance protein [Tannerella sp.]